MYNRKTKNIIVYGFDRTQIIQLIKFLSMGTAASIQSKLFTTVGVGEIHFEGKCDDRRKSITVQSAVSIQVIKPDDKMSINNIKKDIILLHTSPLNDFVKTCFTQESRVRSLKALLHRSDFLLAFVNYASYDFDCRSRLSLADIRIVKVIYLTIMFYIK